MENDLTTYQIYLILLGYLTEHGEEMLKPMLTELYRKAKRSDCEVTNVEMPNMNEVLDNIKDEINLNADTLVLGKRYIANDVARDIINKYKEESSEAESEEE